MPIVVMARRKLPQRCGRKQDLLQTDTPGMMAQAQRMQAKLQKVQEEIKKMEIPGEAGNGAVKVVVNGQHRVLNVTIAPEAMDPEDPEMLEDLVTLAINNAFETLDRITEERMRAAVPLPAGMKFPF